MGMPVTAKAVRVARVNKFSITDADGVDYNLSKFDPVDLGRIVAGNDYTVQFVESKGKNYMRSIQPGNTGSITPSLPRTSVTETKAPGGETPVKPAAVPAAPIVSERAYNRDRSIECQAILKSTLESPAVAQMVVGKNENEVKAILRDVFLTMLTVYDETKAGN